MLTKVNTLPSVTNVAAGSTGLLNLPIGPTYHMVALRYSGVTLAQLTNIELRLDGKTIQRFASGTQLDEINTFWGRGAANGVLKLHLERPELRQLAERVFTAVGTRKASTLTLHVDIDAGAAAPVLTAYAETSGSQEVGAIVKVKQFPVSFATSGQQDIDSIPLNGAQIVGIHMSKAADDITRVEIDANSSRVFEATADVAEDLASGRGFTPQDGYFHVPFIRPDDIRASFPTSGITDFRVRPTLTTSGAVVMVVEYIDTFGGM